MKNKIAILLYGLVLSFLVVSCAGEEEDIFDDSAANRLTKAINTYNDLLCSSENGWILEYFPTNSAKAHIFLAKFKGGMADIACQTSLINSGKFYRDTCLFEVIGDNGPVLSFNTYSNIIHFFCDPKDIGDTDDNEVGKGYEGDYEFIFLNGDENKIELKGKKRGTRTRLLKLPEGQKWEDYFNQLDEFRTTNFDNRVTLTMKLGEEELFTLGNGATGIFNIVPMGGDPVTDTEVVPYLLTGNGIRFTTPFAESGIEVQEFKISDDKNHLISIDDPNIIIVGPENYAEFYFEQISQAQKWALVDDESEMSPAVWSAFAKTKQAFVDHKTSLSQIAYTYSAKNRTDVVQITVPGAKAGLIFFNKELVSDKGLSYSFKNQFADNGKAFYDDYNGVSELINYMSGEFNISTAKTKLNMTCLRFTSKSNSDIWFNVKEQ